MRYRKFITGALIYFIVVLVAFLILGHIMIDIQVKVTTPDQGASSSELNSKRLIEAVASLEKETSDNEDDISTAYLNAFALNQDTVGWILCNKLSVNGPVVQGKDNKEYLRTNFYGANDSHGALFVDARCNLELCPLLKVIHGHNMKDGTMFARVPTLLNLKKTSEAPAFEFYSPETGVATYKVISVFSVSSKEEALPLDVLYSVSDLDKLRDQLVARSLIETDTVNEFDGTDLLILNTCWYGKSGTEHNLHCIVVLCRE